MSDKEFLEMLINALVDHPEDVRIDRTVDEMGVLLTLSIHQSDMGKIIGRSGNTAKAIRTLLRVVGMKNNARVNLKINEPAGGVRSVGSDYKHESTVSNSPVMKSMDEAMEELGNF